jgi:hypothetical protein
MRLNGLKPAAVVGRWIFYRRAYGWHRAELQRAYVQEAHPGEIVGLVQGPHASPGVYPRRPMTNPSPLVLPLDELEIHAVVECEGVVEGVVPPD